MAGATAVIPPTMSQSQPHPQSQIQQPSPPASQPSQNGSTSPTAFPVFPATLRSQTTAKSIHTADISYPESFLRTPTSIPPFPQPKWHGRPSTVEMYEASSPILEEYDPESGFVDSVGEVRESIECDAVNYAREGVQGGEVRTWRGYVEYEESRERWSLRGDGIGKRGLDAEQGIEEGFRKKVRTRH